MADKVTLVMFSGELDKALAAFNIAIGAASSGMEVRMFFTFWGLNIVKRNNGDLKSRGIVRGLLNRLNRGGTRRLPLSRFHMMGLGRHMMTGLMKDAKFPSLDEMIVMASELGVKLMVCTNTMGMMGISEEAFIPQVSSYCGVATYLQEAKESKINLFI